jgi:hypothetical protein
MLPNLSHLSLTHNPNGPATPATPATLAPITPTATDPANLNTSIDRKKEVFAYEETGPPVANRILNADEVRTAWMDGKVMTSMKNSFGFLNEPLKEVVTQMAINTQKISQEDTPSEEGTFNRFFQYSRLLRERGIFYDIDKTKLVSVLGNQALNGVSNWGVRVNIEPFVDEDDEDDDGYGYMLAAHEAFYTCFAAYYDLGPTVTACASVKVDGMDVAIYLMEAGIPGDTLNETINKYSFEKVQRMGADLKQLFRDSGAFNLLIIDVKPGNMVWVQRLGPNNDSTSLVPKFIDFDAQFTIMLESVDSNCLHYLNGVLFLSHIACTLFESGFHHKLSLLYHPLMVEIINIIKPLVYLGDEFCSRLFQLNLKAVKNDLLNPNTTTLRSVGDRVLRQLEHYCQKKRNLPIKPWPDEFKPVLMIDELITELRDIMLRTLGKKRAEMERQARAAPVAPPRSPRPPNPLANKTPDLPDQYYDVRSRDRGEGGGKGGGNRGAGDR